MQKVTCVLNGYRRPERLVEQYHAVVEQSNVNVQVMYWQNTMPEVNYCAPIHGFPNTTTAVSNRNLGVWARFYYALNAKTDWICVFDDDTIPGPLWLRNCLDTHKTHEGLLGTIGVIIPPNGRYHNVMRYGWDGPNEVATPVDFVGHAWFFHRDLLSVFCRELPPIDHVMTVGEDIHFSHMIQKYTDLGTFVPPHPRNNKDLWGSLYGWQFGDDGKATASTNMPHMDSFLQRKISEGFRLIYDDERNI
jgi:hypothetical protein